MSTCYKYQPCSETVFTNTYQQGILSPQDELTCIGIDQEILKTSVLHYTYIPWRHGKMFWT